jgi:hypothetical protein
MGELVPGVKVEQWGAGKLPNGQPKATWYDRHGRSFVLPADPYSIGHYQGRGLTLHPPESPEPLVEDNDWSRGSMNATRGGPKLSLVESSEESEMFGGLPSVEPQRKGRGPDKKPRKRRKKRRKRA